MRKTKGRPHRLWTFCSKDSWYSLIEALHTLGNTRPQAPVFAAINTCKSAVKHLKGQRQLFAAIAAQARTDSVRSLASPDTLTSSIKARL